MDEYGMLDHIREHCFVVARVADALLQGFTLDPGKIPARDEVIAGALLHDIAKTKCLKEDCNHAEVGREMCRHHGYSEIGDIVGEHVILHSFSHERFAQGLFTAKDIIHYADKRVRHDQIVSLGKRLEYIIGRYGNNDIKRHLLIEKNFNKCQDLETYIFAHVRFSPSELSGYVNWKSSLEAC